MFIYKELFLTAGLYAAFVLALPIMATSFLNTFYSITDMAWIGMLGSRAVAGVGVGAATLDPARFVDRAEVVPNARKFLPASWGREGAPPAISPRQSEAEHRWRLGSTTHAITDIAASLTTEAS